MLTSALSLGAAVSEAISRVSKAHQEVISGKLFFTIHWLKAKAHFYHIPAISFAQVNDKYRTES
ncbi:hypothetical protein [Colwellia piezophila]|uniref:hypothetical protein n=1 Tax=Colwellia piezophila TaxID=211668 RepID=UPI0003A96EE1|nr:hypothetical protein [Colwellia piezophila]